MNKINNIVAENISSLRKTNKITQLELAEKLNYSDKAVSKWEHGESLPPIDVLYEIALIFGVDMNYLVTNNTDNKKPQKVLTKQIKSRRLFITLLSILLVWLVAVVLYVCFCIFCDLNLWHLFFWAVPLSFLVSFVFICIWGEERHLYITVSLFIWTLLLSACLQFLQYKIWMILFIGIPIQLAVVLTYLLRKSMGKKYHNSENNLDDMSGKL